jgi:hypothetical protein
MSTSKTKKTVSVKKPAVKKPTASTQKEPTSSKSKSVSKKEPIAATTQKTTSKKAEVKIPKVKLDLSKLPSDINVTTMKSITLLAKGDQKAYIRGTRVFLDDHKSEYGTRFKEVSTEEAKVKHYGRTRSIGTVSDLDDLKRILGLFYKN